MTKAVADGHTARIRVYYEDTDAGGVVYYANYLRFAERARTEWLRELGFEHSRLSREEGALFVVTRCEIDFRASARLDDWLAVETRLQELGKVRMTLRQTIRRAEHLLVELNIDLACVGAGGRPIPWPEALRARLAPAPAHT